MEKLDCCKKSGCGSTAVGILIGFALGFVAVCAAMIAILALSPKSITIGNVGCDNRDNGSNNGNHNKPSARLFTIEKNQ